MIPSFRIKFNGNPIYGYDNVQVTYIVEKRMWHLSAGGGSAGSCTPYTEVLSPRLEEAVERFAIKLAIARERKYCHDCKNPAVDFEETPAQEVQDKLRMEYQCWHGGWEGGNVHQCNARPITIATL